MLKDKSDERLIRIQEVKEITGLSRSYIYALSAKGDFPKSLSLVPGGSSVAWIYSEVNEWIEGRINNRAAEV